MWWRVLKCPAFKHTCIRFERGCDIVLFLAPLTPSHASLSLTRGQIIGLTTIPVLRLSKTRRRNVVGTDLIGGMAGLTMSDLASCFLATGNGREALARGQGSYWKAGCWRFVHAEQQKWLGGQKLLNGPLGYRRAACGKLWLAEVKAGQDVREFKLRCFSAKQSRRLIRIYFDVFSNIAKLSEHLL